METMDGRGGGVGVDRGVRVNKYYEVMTLCKIIFIV